MIKYILVPYRLFSAQKNKKKIRKCSDKSTYLRTGRLVWVAGFVPALVIIFIVSLCYVNVFAQNKNSSNDNLPDYVLEYLGFSKDEEKIVPATAKNNSRSSEQRIKDEDDNQKRSVALPDYVKEFLAFMTPLPFTQEDEKLAETGNKVAIKKIKDGFIRRIDKYRLIIHDAASRFNVPEEIIISVINTESGGLADAKNPTSSAKGLMQIIDSTYTFTRNNLRKKSIFLDVSPFDPKSSIFAGSWYLSYCFNQVQMKHPELEKLNRGVVSHWNYALRYYFFGPGYEKNTDEKFVYYSNSKVLKLKGDAYADKILTYARML